MDLIKEVYIYIRALKAKQTIFEMTEYDNKNKLQLLNSYYVQDIVLNIISSSLLKFFNRHFIKTKLTI